jgi:hypothetical protein
MMIFQAQKDILHNDKKDEKCLKLLDLPLFLVQHTQNSQRPFDRFTKQRKLLCQNSKTFFGESVI